MSPRLDGGRQLAIGIALVLLLILPSVAAHVPNARPVGQASQLGRIVDMSIDGVTGRATLLVSGEPTRNWIQHTIDPARGHFTVEYRHDLASPEGRFMARWGIHRLIEYRDLNHDGRYQPESETVVKSYPLTAYSWRIASPVQRVQVGGVSGYDAIWEGNLSGSPSLRLEVVATGTDFTDEGAFTRGQDVLLYLDLLDMPPRSVGSLFALELSYTAPAGTRAVPVRVGEYVTGVYTTTGTWHPMFIWGGEASIDGRETKVEATIGEPEASGSNETRTILVHVPTIDRTARFIIIDAFEYEFVSKRTPVEAAAPILALVLAGLLATRRDGE